MGTPGEPKPAKYFVALLAANPELLVAVEKELTAILGPIDHRSEALPWTVSRYYENEMGCGLWRRFLSFAPLISPERLVETKLATQGVEAIYRSDNPPSFGRTVNCDPGYLEAGKVVLASTKNAGHRIYLGRGIYAETTLVYYDRGFHEGLHTYQDYLWPATLDFLSSVRSAYLRQLKQQAGISKES
jgi:hypothetical protein